MTKKQMLKAAIAMPIWIVLLIPGMLLYVASEIVESMLDGLGNWVNK
jgi:hypothetical protein